MGALAQAASALSANQKQQVVGVIAAQASTLASMIPIAVLRAPFKSAVGTMSANPNALSTAIGSIEAILPPDVKKFIGDAIGSVGGAPGGGAARGSVMDQIAARAGAREGLTFTTPGVVNVPFIGRVSTPILIGGAAALDLVAFMLLRKK